MVPKKASADPFSAEYGLAQMDLYHHIAGRRYQTDNEATVFDVDLIERRPFPYSTGSMRIVGDQLLSIGSLLRRVKVPPGARILEFGPGWGNTTMALAQSGFSVTAVDIEPRFCELLSRRAVNLGVKVDVVNADFFWAESVESPYDAAIFFECFHHCADHLRLLRALGNAIKPGGRIYMAGEPITHNFPVPWGIRFDGESLWAIRKHGWLELGFNERYFKHALAANGWRGVKYQSMATPSATVWEIGRRSEFRPNPMMAAASAVISRLLAFAARAVRTVRRG